MVFSRVVGFEKRPMRGLESSATKYSAIQRRIPKAQIHKRIKITLLVTFFLAMTVFSSLNVTKLWSHHRFSELADWISSNFPFAHGTTRSIRPRNWLRRWCASGFPHCLSLGVLYARRTTVLRYNLNIKHAHFPRYFFPVLFQLLHPVFVYGT